LFPKGEKEKPSKGKGPSLHVFTKERVKGTTKKNLVGRKRKKSQEKKKRGESGGLAR